MWLHIAHCSIGGEKFGFEMPHVKRRLAALISKVKDPEDQHQHQHQHQHHHQQANTLTSQY